MKRAIATAALLTITTFTAAGSAVAWGPSTPEIDARQAQQEARIRAGIRDGSLTRREAERLLEEQRRIQEMESAAMRDGRLTPAERAAIARAQDEADRNIYRERHDYERRRPRWGWWRSSEVRPYVVERRWWWY